MFYFSINGTLCSTYLQEFKQPIKNERGEDENVKKKHICSFSPLCSNCHLFCIIPVVNVIRSSDAAQQARFITFLLFIDFYIYAIKYMSTISYIRSTVDKQYK